MENLLQLIWEQKNLGLAILDAGGCWLQVNLGFEQFSGWPGCDLLGKPARELFGERVSLKTQEIVAGDALKSGIWRVQQKNGDWVYREITVTPLTDAEGQDLQMITITPATVYQTLRDQTRLSALAAEVGVTLGKSLSLSESLHGCTRALVKYLEAVFAGIWLLNPITHLLELQAYAGEQPTEAEFGGRIPLGVSIIGYIAQNLQPYVTGEAIQRQATSRTEPGKDQVVAFAGYPLILEGRLIGVIALCSRQQITQGSRETLLWVANAVAVAIDRVKAREELLSRRETLLFRLASQIRNSLELDTVLEVAVREIQNLLQIDWCWFIWYHPPAPDTEATLSLNDSYWEIVKEAKQPHVPSFTGTYTLKDAQPEWLPVLSPLLASLLNLEMIRLEPRHHLDRRLLLVLEALDMAGILALPLRTDSGKIGVIGCGMSRRSPNLPSDSSPWKDSELELIKAVADQLAIAITQAELYVQARTSAEIAQNQTQQLTQALQQLQCTQAQLIQTEKISSLGQLVAGIAHEINNPINFISGNLAYATDAIQELLTLLNLYQTHYPRPVAPVQTAINSLDLEFIQHDLPQLIDSMKLGIDRINEIIKSLRNFSRSDQQKKELFNIHEGIDNTLLILRHRLQNSDAHIEIIKAYSNIPPIRCYIGQINQVFMNIISNAIDALETQPSPRQITLETSRSSDLLEPLDGGKTSADIILIKIRDNGPGIPETVQAHLFDSFFTTKPLGKGTGLGLSISYQIVVEKHQGSLKCLSRPGSGTEFWIQLPI